ncbi:MAG: DUF3298 and DUF4163 domain-containing protein [Clostridia bacterium]|nr:DUF3298 and DUF4163 domain-containing protein [Clostridia bacterium]MBQ7751792.1 DUF3298 and DUF4163 domain-containing protein [Clostridia bacterium]
MHNFIKICLAFAVAFLLSACGNGIKIDTVDNSYSSDTVTANIKIPKLSGLSSRDLENKINEEFSASTDALLEKWEKSAKETGEQSLFDMTTAVPFNKNGFLSMVTDYEYFARKAHKNRFRIAKNIDNSLGLELSLSDLFDGDTYIDALNAMLNDAVSASPEKYGDIWARPKISQNQGFYIDGENFVIFYPPYELSYYERGFVEIPLPIEELLTYMKPMYREIFAG